EAAERDHESPAHLSRAEPSARGPLRRVRIVPRRARAGRAGRAREGDAWRDGDARRRWNRRRGAAGASSAVRGRGAEGAEGVRGGPWVLALAWAALFGGAIPG